MDSYTFEVIGVYPHYGWVVVNLPGGHRLTKDQVDFDTDREDVHVNEHGVVHFYNEQTARQLIKFTEIEGG